MLFPKACLLPAWLIVSVIAADAFFPVVSKSHRVIRSNLKIRNTNNNHRGRQTTTVTTTSKSDESTSAEEIPRGGGSANVQNKPPALPSIADYRKFAIPCLGLWVSVWIILLYKCCTVY